MTTAREASRALWTAYADTTPEQRATYEAIRDPIALLCFAAGLPEPVYEYRFAPPRRWRFDYAWPAQRVAVEVEGGVFVQGRHARGPGMLRDIEKYNAAQVLGWIVLRTTPSTLHRLRPDLAAVLTTKATG